MFNGTRRKAKTAGKVASPFHDSKSAITEHVVTASRVGEQYGQAAEEKVAETVLLPEDSRAQVSAQRAVSLVVALMVGGLVAAFLLPVAIDEIVAVDTSSWGSGASSLWDVMDLIVVLAVFLFFIGVALAAANRVS